MTTEEQIIAPNYSKSQAKTFEMVQYLCLMICSARKGSILTCGLSYVPWRYTNIYNVLKNSLASSAFPAHHKSRNIMNIKTISHEEAKHNKIRKLN